MTDVTRFDVVIVGAGPAGLLAAHAAGGHTSSIAVIDQAPAPGGQIWRRDVGEPGVELRGLEDAVFQRATFIGGATVIDAATTGGRHRLLIEREGVAFAVESATVILATGARELFLPFPGWTLPGVMGVGALQAMMKSGYSVRGRRVVVAGSGPLLLAVAAAAVRKGAEVVAVIEQAPLRSMLRFGGQLAMRPSTAIQGLGYLQELPGGVLQFGKWVATAIGSRRLESVTVADGSRASRLDCEILASGYGLVPNTEVARRLGCLVTGSGITVDEALRTSVPGVFAAGECVGIAGVDAAYSEGLLAGLSAVGAVRPAGPVWISRWRRQWQGVLATTFAPRREVLTLSRPDTIVCRCEDVRMRDVASASSAREAKLYTRAGMGACQGRVCGAALQAIRGWRPDTVRAPLQPASVSTLMAPASGALSE